MQQIKYIGVCLSTVHEEDRFNFIMELNRHAVQKNYRLLIFNSCADLYEQSGASNEGASSIYALIPYEKLSALIIFPHIMYDKKIVNLVVDNCRKNNIPVISMDKDIEGCIRFSFSYADVFGKLCSHVIDEHGARNIFMIAGFKDNVYSEERVNALRKVMADRGMTLDMNNVGYGCFWELPTLDVLNKWFVEEKRAVPDAIICANDFMAITASSYIQAMGYKVPDDCIITGFDGIRQTEYLPPNITTCKQDFAKMGSLIVETIERVNDGENVKGPFYVDFNIIYSQSCGCKQISYEHVGCSIQSLIESLRLSDERQKMISSTLAAIPRISDINFLPRMLLGKFRIKTCVFALNEGVFDPPDFGVNYKGQNCFSDKMNIIWQRYGDSEYAQCTIPTKKLLPRYDLLAENTEPIIVCSANYTDMVMGYCVFQPPIDIDAYEKMHNFMTTTGSAFGNYHSRAQIRSINDRLIEANEELKKLSQRDFMTGLFNRRGFFDQLKNQLRSEEASGSKLVIISVDLDGLKHINDTYGHAEGDNAIITVGKALISSSLQNEICARFGGDEFCSAILLEGDDPERFFMDFKKRFFDYLWDYNRNSGKPYDVKASIGSHAETVDAVFSEEHVEQIINIADEHMYEYKIAHKKK